MKFHYFNMKFSKSWWFLPYSGQFSSKASFQWLSSLLRGLIWPDTLISSAKVSTFNWKTGILHDFVLNWSILCTLFCPWPYFWHGNCIWVIIKVFYGENAEEKLEYLYREVLSGTLRGTSLRDPTNARDWRLSSTDNTLRFHVIAKDAYNCGSTHLSIQQYF